MINEVETVAIETDKRFSESMMWTAQKSYYDEKGIDAWTEDVPFYITSNPFIGRSYAQMMISFIQDWIRTNPTASKNPFYILELGTGTGQFSFYLLKNLLVLQEALHLEHIEIKYIMSDVTTRPFDFWEKHPALKPFLDSGMLDFAEYDLYKGGDIQLRRAGKVLGENSMKNPLVLVANYLFDSVATDVFTIHDGKIYESLVTVSTEKENLEDGRPLDWKKIALKHNKHLIKSPYYNDEFDEILFSYQETLLDSHFQFPIASLKALRHLQSLCNHKLLLVTSDKGYTNIEELDNVDFPELDFHGSFSVMVNYHAIGKYAKQQLGEYFIQSFRENIVTGVFSFGFTLEKLPELRLSTKQVIDGFSPTDYFLIYEHFTENYKRCSLEVMASYLNLSVWDPYVFDQVGDYLSEIAEDGDPEVVTYLSENMHRIADNFYFFPSSNDTLFDIGIFYQNISRLDEAIKYYEKSKAVFGESDVVSFNIGMCLHALNKNEEALIHLKDSLRLNSESKDAEKWIEAIEKERT